LIENILPILFFIIAFIYSSAGLGGASSYTAIMAIMGISYQIIPTTSLALNIVVTFFGTINYWRNGYGKIKLVGPFLITSIPMAYIAGSLNLNELMFQTALLVTLILVVIRIYFFDTFTFSFQLSPIRKWIFIILLGSILGFSAGAIGIGGGIYLVPLIIIFGLGSEKEAAAAGATFIFMNSLVGFIARFKSGTFDLDFILPLICSVAIGGFLGSYYGSKKYDAKTIQKVMGGIIIIAIILLTQKIL
jgi:hypothetical protein|tara:strand:- start:766 stop:1506 length:741 start_codon:yes stop_codon:yes gene_type:complete